MFDFILAASASDALPPPDATVQAQPYTEPAAAAPAFPPGSESAGVRAPSATPSSSKHPPVFFSGAVRGGSALGASVAVSLWVPITFSCGHLPGGSGLFASGEAGLFGAQADVGLGGAVFAGCGWYRQSAIGYAGAFSVLRQWRNWSNDLAEARTLYGGVLTFEYFLTVRPGFYFENENAGERLFTLAFGFGI